MSKLHWMSARSQTWTGGVPEMWDVKRVSNEPLPTTKDGGRCD